MSDYDTEDYGIMMFDAASERHINIMPLWPNATQHISVKIRTLVQYERGLGQLGAYAHM